MNTGPSTLLSYCSNKTLHDSDSKESACNVGDLGYLSGSWRREWLPTPVFFPREFHGQRSLVGYSPWDHKESESTERLIVSLSLYTII